MMRFLFAVVLAALCLSAESFRYPVYRKDIPRHESGSLLIDESGISYQSDSKKKSIQIPFLEIHEADVSNPREIRIETYEALKRKLMGHRSYTFQLRDSASRVELVRFLSAHVKRPVKGFRGIQSQAAFEIPAYHRHRLGGCNGTLRIGQNEIQFVADRAQDSRTWTYNEVETVGSMNSFHFRISTLAETYNFDLKEPLPTAAYDLSFKSVVRIH